MTKMNIRRMPLTVGKARKLKRFIGNLLANVNFLNLLKFISFFLILVREGNLILDKDGEDKFDRNQDNKLGVYVISKYIEFCKGIDGQFDQNDYLVNDDFKDLSGELLDQRNIRILRVRFVARTLLFALNYTSRPGARDADLPEPGSVPIAETVDDDAGVGATESRGGDSLTMKIAALQDSSVVYLVGEPVHVGAFNLAAFSLLFILTVPCLTSTT